MRLPCLLLCYFLSFAALSDDDSIFIAAHDYYPYVYMEDGEIKGTYYAVIKEAFQRMGLSPTFAIIPWEWALLELKKGQIDALFPAYKNAERAQYADYGAAIDTEVMALFVRADSKVEFDGDIAKLSNYSFGLGRGYSYGALLDTAIEKRVIDNLVYAGANEKVHKMLLLGRFDIMPANSDLTWFLQRSLGEDWQIRELKPPINVEDLYLMFSKKRNHTELIKRYDQRIAEMRKDGSYDVLMQH